MGRVVKKHMPLLFLSGPLSMTNFRSQIQTRSRPIFVVSCYRARCTVTLRISEKMFQTMWFNSRTAPNRLWIPFINVTLSLLSATFTKISWRAWTSHLDKLSLSRISSLVSKFKSRNSTCTLIPSKYQPLSQHLCCLSIPTSTLVIEFLFWLLQHHELQMMMQKPMNIYSQLATILCPLFSASAAGLSTANLLLPVPLFSMPAALLLLTITMTTAKKREKMDQPQATCWP